MTFSNRMIAQVAVVAVYLVVMGCLSDKRTNDMIVATVVACVLFWGVSRTVEDFTGWDNVADNKKVDQYDYYDSLLLKTKDKDGGEWRHSPANEALFGPKDVLTIFGTPVGLEDTQSSYAPAGMNWPTVDGSKDGLESMFSLAFNKVSPECCPSTYSTDRGCVCTNDMQRNYINSRGGNQSCFSNY